MHKCDWVKLIIQILYSYYIRKSYIYLLYNFSIGKLHIVHSAQIGMFFCIYSPFKVSGCFDILIETISIGRMEDLNGKIKDVFKGIYRNS
jgi:hypothetical protein